jgi:hypothetical protein
MAFAALIAIRFSSIVAFMTWLFRQDGYWLFPWHRFSLNGGNNFAVYYKTANLYHSLL